MKNTLFKSCILATTIALLPACDNSNPTAAAHPQQKTYESTHPRITDTAPQVTQRGTLTIATKDKANTLDPHNPSSGGDVKLINQLYERLLTVDPNDFNKLQPVLASSWSVSEDNLSITFKIKPNIKFHDGASLDAQACKTSFLRLQGKHLPAPKPPYKSFYNFIKSIDANNLTLTVHLNRPVPRVALRNFTMFPASIVSPRLLEATINMTPDQRTNFVSDWAAGTGAYYLAKHDPSQGRTRLHAFNDYHGGAPTIKALLFTQIKDSNTQFESLKANLVQNVR